MLRTLRTFALLAAASAPVLAPALPALAAEQAEEVRIIEIVVDGSYAPSRITVQQGERVRLKFVRKDWSGCTRELVIPALKLRKELPTNKAVFVDLPTTEAGEVEFRCGMNMVRGTITVTAR
jgi:plastocyanin domain-containing protein